MRPTTAIALAAAFGLSVSTLTAPASASVPRTLTQLFVLEDAPIANRPGETLTPHPQPAIWNSYIKYSPATDGTHVSFVAASTGSPQAGHYTWSPGVGIRANADQSTPSPYGGEGALADVFSRHRIQNGRVAFLTTQSEGNAGFADLGAGPTSVIRLGQPSLSVPDETVTGFSSLAIDGSAAYFTAAERGTFTSLQRATSSGRQLLTQNGDPIFSPSGTQVGTIGFIDTSLLISPAVADGAVVFATSGLTRGLILHRNGVNTRIADYSASRPQFAFDGRHVLYRTNDGLSIFDEQVGLSTAFAGNDSPFPYFAGFDVYALDAGRVLYTSFTDDFAGIVLYERGVYTPLLDLFRETEIHGVPVPSVEISDFFSVHSFANDVLVFEGTDPLTGLQAVYSLTIPAPGAIPLAGLALAAAWRRRR